MKRLLSRPALAALFVLGLLPAVYVGLIWLDLIPERYIRLERPLLAFPSAIVTTFIALRLRGLSSRQHRARRWLTEISLGLAALTAALAVLGPELGKPLDRLAVIVVVDRSRSIDLVPDAEGRVRSELQVAETGMRDQDLIGTLAFAADAQLEDPLRPKTQLPAPQRVEVGRDATDLGSAIRRSLAEVPADAAARIVILSDGVSTRGDALDAAAAAVAADVPVDVVPLDQRQLADVRVIGVRMASRAHQGETLDLRVITGATQASEIELRVYRNGELLRKGRTEVGQGEDVVHLKEKAPGPGLHRYEVQVSATDPKHDEAPEDNTGSTFVRVRGQASALILEGNPELAGALQAAFESGEFGVTVAGPSAVPADVAGFAAYDVVVLSDISATLLAPSQIQALASYVRDLGGGLLLMGGDRSLGPGGYGKTPIEEVSPVSFDLKQERQRASLAEMIIIDYSGSMAMRAGKHTKLELANEAAVRSAELLGAGDRLGVMHVDTAIQNTVPMGPVIDKKKIASQIRAVGPGGGGIYVDLSLSAAYTALAAEKVALKHVLLFSDGSDAEEKHRAETLVSGAKARNITTSVVALGRGRDVVALERMSKLGGGRFYLIEDASRLPAVFAQETILAAKSALNEVTFKPSLSAVGPPVRGIGFDSAPPLTGYVVTIPKGRAQVWLRGPESDPILATWSIGVGRSAAFTSDFKDRWGKAWTAWSGGGRLFAQLARDIARRADDPRVRLEAEASNGELEVRATVVDDDGRTESFRRLKVRVGGPDGFQRDVPLEASGAGAYSASIPLSQPGAYIATAVDELDNKAVATTGAVLTAGDELRPTGTDRALLRRISTLTGGKERDTLAGIFNDRVARRFAYTPLTPWLVGFAAGLLLLSVATRRLSLPTWLTGVRSRLRAAQSRRQEAREARLREREAAGRTAEALLGRARAGRDDAAAQAHAPPPVTVADAPPPSRPQMARANRPPSTAASPRVAPSQQAHPPAAQPTPAAGGKSAAEILLARRRKR